jgi:hypothetical protein
MQRQCANANVSYLFVGHVEHSSSALSDSAARLRATPHRVQRVQKIEIDFASGYERLSDRDDSIIMRRR